MGSMHSVIRTVVGYTLTILLVAVPNQGWSIEVPVFVQAEGGSKVLLLLDDSESMNYVLEHPYYVEHKESFKYNRWWQHQMPSIFFRAESGEGALTSSTPLKVALIEHHKAMEHGYRDEWKEDVTQHVPRGPVGNPWQSMTFATAASTDWISELECSSRGCWDGERMDNNNLYWTYARNYQNAPSLPRTGAHALKLFRDPLKVGPQIFHPDYVERQNPDHTGPRITDSDGHEYLYIRYRRSRSDGCPVASVLNYYGIEELHPPEVRARLGTQGLGEKTALPQDGYYTFSDQNNNGGGGGGGGKPTCTGWFDGSSSFYGFGGKVVFNGKEITLGVGQYDGNYLSWIFFDATPEQLAELPTQTRLDAAKESLKKIVVDNPNVDFALDTFNRGVATERPGTIWEYVVLSRPRDKSPSIVVPFGKSREEIVAGIDSVVGWNSTPIVQRYVESLNYFRDGEGSFPSPIISECESYNIMVVTDGFPTKEEPVKLLGEWITDYDKDGSEKNSNESCDQETCEAYGDDAAFYAFNSGDFSKSLAGRQYIRTGMIGFGLSYELLDSMAQKGGTGKSVLANSTAELTAALEEFLKAIVVSSVSGGGSNSQESYGADGTVFRSRFQADFWTGHVDAFAVKQGSGELVPKYDVAVKLEDRATPRSIYAGIDTDDDGVANEVHMFDPEATAELFRPHLFKHFDDGTLDPSVLMTPLQDFTSAEAAKTLIEYIHGKHRDGLRLRDRDGDGGNADMGDVVYSSIATTDIRNGNYSKFNGYREFSEQQKAVNSVAIFGSNDGLLHGIRVADGEELWAYIPSEHLPNLELLSRLSYNTEFRRSYVDGSVTTHDVFVGGSWRTIAVAGMRTGGSSFVILDVTSPNTPGLLFEINAKDLYGQSWGEATVVPTLVSDEYSVDPSAYRWNLVIGTGEGKTGPGTSLLVYNLDGNSSQKPTELVLEASAPIGTRVGPAAAVQSDRDLSIDRLYVGTEAGHMYRIETDGVPSAWKVQRLFSGSESQPITTKPITVLVENPTRSDLSLTDAEKYGLAVGVYWGTGRYDRTSDEYLVKSPNFQRIFGILDPVNVRDDDYKHARSNVTLDSLQQQSSTVISARMNTEGGHQYLLPEGKAGFYINLLDSITMTAQFLQPAGMVVSSAQNLKGLLLFPTFLPGATVPGSSCRIGGHAFLNGINFRTGSGVLIDYSDSKDPYYNGGVFDINDDDEENSDDLTEGFDKGYFAPALDTRVELPLELTKLKPYRHDGKLKLNDLWMYEGTVRPAVVSLGNTGVPGGVGLLPSSGQIVVQASFAEPPKMGKMDQGGPSDDTPNEDGEAGDNEDSGENNPSSGTGVTAPPPETVPVQNYNSGAELLSFHEVVN